MNQLLPFILFLRAAIPHMAALPAVVIFRRGWGVHYAGLVQFTAGWIMAVPVMIISPSSSETPR